MKIKINQFLAVLSLALDLAGREAIENIMLNHGRRVAYISLRLAERLELDKDQRLCLYYAALLHDLGITESMYQHHSQEKLIKEHCHFGSEHLSNNSLFPEEIQDIVLCHHENWDGTGPFGKRRDSIPLLSQIIRISDQFELFFKKDIPNYNQRKRMKEMVDKYSGSHFSPLVAEATNDLIHEERFWWDLSFNNQDLVLKTVAPEKTFVLSAGEILDLSKIFSSIIDLKSTFTYSHSSGIASKAESMASEYGLSAEKKDILLISAHLHDLGKLAVPNSILDKNGKLNDEEYSIIKSHVYYSKFLLRSIDGFEEIAEIAGNHHEKLDGSGYAEGLRKKEMSLLERLMGVLDIYQALTEDRPYRSGLSHRKAISMLKKMADNNKVDGEIVKKVEQIF